MAINIIKYFERQPIISNLRLYTKAPYFSPKLKKVMKNLFVFISLLFIQWQSFGCSYCSYGFCGNHDLVIKGEIIHSSDTLLSFKIDEILAGSFASDTIHLFGKDTIIPIDTVTSCGFSYDFDISKTGNVGDHLILGLQRIDSVEYEWETLGHYRRWVSDIAVDKLTFSNDSVFGVILYDECGAEQINIQKMSYPDFKALFVNNEMQCDLLASAPEKLKPAALEIYPNPFTGVFVIRNHDFEKVNAEVVDALGQSVSVTKHIKRNTIEVDGSALKSGIYFVRLSDSATGHIIGRSKIVKE